MEQLLERYVYDVIRRLPQKEREEVKEELYANIYDMLPQDADTEQLKEVLYQLGDPALLAERYRQSPRYLISPRMYDSYIRSIKKAVPIIAVILLCVGFILGAIECLELELNEVSSFFKHAFSKGIELGASSVFYSLVWLTIGFMIADRTTNDKLKNKPNWSLDDLPKALPDEKDTFSLADCIIELVFTVIFLVAAVFFCTNSLPIGYMVQFGSISIENIFTDSFIQILIPVLLLLGLLGIFECIAKIICRRYTKLVLIAILVNNLGSMIIWIFVFTRKSVFTSELSSLIVNNEKIGEKFLDWLSSFPQSSLNPVAIGCMIIVVAASLAASAHAIYKTWKCKKIM